MAEETATHNLFGPRHPAGGSAPRAGLVLLWAPEIPGVPRIPDVIPLGDAPLAIGREAPPGGLSLQHAGVSRLHARIHRQVARDGSGAFVLTDLDSRNGTLVDGCKVRSIPLEDGDEIRIGDVIFKFVERELELHLSPPPIDPRTTSLVGGAQLRKVANEVVAIARADLPVLVLGETGTGKEVVAQMIHTASARPGKLSAINCAAIPTNLLESELFGYKRGAFSGADRDKIGLVSVAHKGTLFLDEVGDMPPEAQAKLLRLLETREVLPLGSLAPEKVDVRVVSATHRELPTLVEQGRFRGDLFARLNGHCVQLPALRARKEDLRALLRHFLAKHGRPRTTATAPFMAAVCHYDWPYNVRELEAAVRRALALLEAEGPARDGELDVRHLPDAIQRHMEAYGAEPAPPAAGGSIPPSFSSPSSTGGRDKAPTEEAMREIVARHQGNVAAIARELRKDRVQVHRWMKKYGLRPEEFRK